jgi:hypothetical protein
LIAFSGGAQVFGAVHWVGYDPNTKRPMHKSAADTQSGFDVFILIWPILSDQLKSSGLGLGRLN